MAEMDTRKSQLDQLTAAFSKFSLDLVNRGGNNNMGGNNGGNNGPGQYNGPRQDDNGPRQFNNSARYTSSRNPGPRPQQDNQNCSICGEAGHWRGGCQILQDMIQKGIVHIRNGMVYQGESGDRLVNRAGYRTIAEAALAQHQSSGAT